MDRRPSIITSDGTRYGEMRVPGPDWQLDLGSRSMTYIRIDHQTRLQFDGVEIVIGCPFTLQTGNEIFHLDEAQELGPLLGVYPDALETASVGSDGTLHLRLERGESIEVQPDPNYEAWQINGPGMAVVVCPPGGSPVAVWADDSDGD